MIDVKGEQEKVQSTLDGITGNGFWFSVEFPEGDDLTLFPYRIEVLGAHPEIGPDGSVKMWRYSVLAIDRGFADFGASVHGNHLHVVDRIEWTRNASDRIYAARLRDEDGNRILINEIDASEHPDLAGEWDAYVKRLAAMPERVEECLDTIRQEFMEMVEARFS